MDDAPHARGARRRAQRRRTLGLGGVVLVVAVALTLAAGGMAWAGFQGQLADSPGTFSAGTMLLTGTTPGNVTCSSSSTATPISTNSALCSGDPLPAGPLGTTPAAAASSVADPGNADPTAATLAAPSCGVAQLLDTASSDPALAMGGVTYGQSGPLGSGAIAFDGSDGWFESTASYSTPGAFTLLAWFKAGTGAGGTIFNLSDSEFDSGATGSDRDLWIDPSGRLVWGIDTLDAQGAATPIEVTSTNPVTDGNWHLAAATYSGLTSTLYVDGVAQGSAQAGSAMASESGWYPSIGWGPEGSTGWADPPTSAFFDGALAMVSLSPSAVTAAQVSALAAAASAGNYESGLSSDAPPTDNWEMADSGTQAYTGAVPISGGGTTLPCQRVEVTVEQVQGATTSCAVPAGAGACPALSPATLLSSLETAAPIDPPSTTVPVQLSLSMALVGVSPPGVAGLNLLPGLTIAASRTGWSAALAYDSAAVGM